MKNRITNIVICTLIILSFISCHRIKTDDDLVNYMYNAKTGLLKTNVIEEWEFRLVNKPTDLFVASEIRHAKNVKPELVDSLRNKYNKYIYFIFDIKQNEKDALSGSGNFTEYSARVDMFSFKLPAYLNMVTSNNDTLYTADYNFQRNFGIGTTTSMILAFERERINDAKWLQVNLYEFGLDVGQLNFRFKSKDIDRASKIKLPLVSKQTKNKKNG